MRLQTAPNPEISPQGVFGTANPQAPEQKNPARSDSIAPDRTELLMVSNSYSAISLPLRASPLPYTTV